MKRWLVRIGQSEAIVDADTATDAMTKFWTMWDDVDLDDEDFPDANYSNMSAIEVIGDEVFWDTESALKASGRMGRPQSEIPQPPG